MFLYYKRWKVRNEVIRDFSNLFKGGDGCNYYIVVYFRYLVIF